MSWLKNAFAVDPPGPAEPTPEQQVPVDWVCRQVARRGMTTPALLALEMSRPLNYVSAQFMHWLGPIVWTVASQLTHEHYKQFAAFLEHRGAIEYLCRRIEHFEGEAEQDRRGRRDGGVDPAPEDGRRKA